jgi:hypothetical protein
MDTREKIGRRFKELEGELDDVIKTIEKHRRVSAYGVQGYLSEKRTRTIESETIDTNKWYSWCTSAMHLLKLAFGQSAIYFAQFEKVFNSGSGYSKKTEALGGIFSAAKADYAGGFAVGMEASIAGEIFADFVALAKEALGQKQKDVAAVLACAALEDALKRIGAANGLEVSEKEMSDVINALIGARVVEGGAAKILRSMTKTRNHALHAEWDKISEAEIGGVIGLVEQLILIHLSPSK